MKNFSFRNDILPLKNKLFRLALRITLNEADAEDIVQETLIKVWNQRENWENISSIEAFCMTVCRNLALDSIKKAAKKTGSLEEIPYESADKAATPLDSIQVKDSLSLIENIVNALPEKQKTALQLRDFEGKSYKEIAQIMMISEDQVKISIFRARQVIKQRFHEFNDYGL